MGDAQLAPAREKIEASRGARDGLCVGFYFRQKRSPGTKFGAQCAVRSRPIRILRFRWL